ncbi:alpha-tocopherol transfer protein-like isoform X2 [Schistocerca nitens]|uniref:alpha-tocopherol transfer protein-like isoform X2 n=1 Tax=Schistocerca nitens TaxID=7011 RepID=UPI002119014C|nr:alpha-tocopherol transfer protein-like isoform X2 [Schistocerca nitens]
MMAANGLTVRMAREWVRPADEYVCRLSKETQELARVELREDPATRQHALQQMRSWITSNPRIVNCRLDANFLLRFLRTKKFSCPMAQESLERYLLLRQTFSHAFRNLDINNPRMDYLISAGYVFATPQRDKLGRRVVIYRPGVFDPYKFTNEDMCRVHGIAWETLMECEENQVRGYVHFGDGAGVGLPYLTLFTPREAVRIVKNGERTLPMRHKEVHGFNIHPSLKYALDFGFSLITEKIKKRIKLYTCVEDTLDFIDRKLLPKEYGGVMPMADMITLWKEELRQSRDILLANDEMKIREEMYSAAAKEGAVSALKKGMYCGRENDMFGITGSFRKLEVD